MAYSKNAALRYNTLDECFSSKSFNKKELLAYVNDKIFVRFGETISLRTLDSDIKKFRDTVNGFAAPLPPNIQTLRYSNPNFSISQLPLLEEENDLLESTIDLLKRLRSKPEYNRLYNALINFEISNKKNHESFEDVFYDHNDEYDGIRYFTPMYHHIKNKEVLEVTYKGYGPEAQTNTFLFHPHVLKQYNRRWFVFGLNASIDKTLTFREKWCIPLDNRIQSFEIVYEEEFEETNTNWSTFFREMVGTTHRGELHQIHLRFSEESINYFKSKPFHPDADTPYDATDDNEIQFQSVVNKELVQQILSYGKGVKVLGPQILIDQIKSEIKMLYDYYN